MGLVQVLHIIHVILSIKVGFFLFQYNTAHDSGISIEFYVKYLILEPTYYYLKTFYGHVYYGTNAKLWYFHVEMLIFK